MASDQQLALATRTARGGHTAQLVGNGPRQVVPAFLAKLHEMVNADPSNDLIKWNDKGDQFCVTDHERFAREVLPKWFKHQNFSSFVRQLNMYGFRKVPHLQQGVLKSESDTETWTFEHANFRRGQQDLLCLIQRKKQATPAQAAAAAASTSDIPAVEYHDGPLPLPAPQAAQQLLDVNSIMSGITAVKRHQATISAELAELKASNEHLWQEALAARERHKKHQDTINRILRFLAGVFGQGGAQMHRSYSGGSGDDGEEGEEAPSVVIPRKRQRLMIEDKRDANKGKGVHLTVPEPDSFDYDTALGLRGVSPNPSERFVTVETPITNPPESPRSERGGHTRPSLSRAASSSTTIEQPTPAPTAASAPEPAQAPLPPSALARTPPPDGPYGMSPATMQKLLQALASQPNFQMPSIPQPYDDLEQQQQLTTFDPAASWLAPSPPAIAPAPPASTLSTLSDFLDPAALAAQDDRRQRIEDGIEGAEQSLNDILAQFAHLPGQLPEHAPSAGGLLPEDIAAFFQDFPTQATGDAGYDMGTEAGAYNFADSLNLDGPGGEDGDGDTLMSTAFLDEVASQASDTPPLKAAKLLPSSPQAPNPRKKRKSDAASTPTADPQASGGGGKTKRKK